MRHASSTAGLLGLALVAACGTTVPTAQQQAAQVADGTTGTAAGQAGTSGVGGLGAPGPGLSTGGTSSAGAGGVVSPHGTGGATTQVGGGSAGSGTTSSTPGAFASKGFGWDAGRISLGFVSQEDQATVIRSLGVNLNPGSVQRQAKAVIDDLNARGGLFGRKLQAVFHDNGTMQSASDPSGTAQLNCAQFTQDTPVVAVFNNNTSLEEPNLLQCLKKRGLPYFSDGFSTFDARTYATYSPSLRTVSAPDLDAFTAAFVPELKAIGYLGGWNTTTAQPAAAPARVGLLEPDTQVGHVTAQLLLRLFNKQGTATAPPYFYSPNPSEMTSDMQSAVLQFRQAGVTHMIDITNVAAPLLFFASAAQQQNYYPRWGMTSWTLPQLAVNTLTQEGTQKQLTGSMGVGWVPAVDTDGDHDVADTPARKHCRDIMTKAGEAITGDNNRFALANAYTLCDAVEVFVAAAKRAGNLTLAGLTPALRSVPSSLSSRATFGYHDGSAALPARYRALAYHQECGCYDYQGQTGTFG